MPYKNSDDENTGIDPLMLEEDETKTEDAKEPTSDQTKTEDTKEPADNQTKAKAIGIYINDKKVVAWGRIDEYEIPPFQEALVALADMVHRMTVMITEDEESQKTSSES